MSIGAKVAIVHVLTNKGYCGIRRRKNCARHRNSFGQNRKQYSFEVIADVDETIFLLFLIPS